mmetsp:Transcript_98953/g.275419  ORF Transcript_98953/g.275419 Transcript_98953/m.275419 type:complete len:200 (-) Transcript_98953:306-905(-)
MNLSAICSAQDFPSPLLVGCQLDLWTTSTSSMSAASSTYRAATSLLSFHFASTSALAPSRILCACGSPLFSFRRLAVPLEVGVRLSVDRRRFSVRFSSTGSRISSGTCSRAKSSSRCGSAESSSSPWRPSSSSSSSSTSCRKSSSSSSKASSGGAASSSSSGNSSSGTASSSSHSSPKPASSGTRPASTLSSSAAASSA